MPSARVESGVAVAVSVVAAAGGLPAAFTAALHGRSGSAALRAPRSQPPAALGEPAAAAAPAGGLTSATGIGGVAAVAAVAVLAARRARPLAAGVGARAVVCRAFESELGVQAPVGFWDPLGLSADGDVETFKRRRETELKHGRVSMLATMGYIAPEYFKFGGYLSPSAGVQFSDVPNGLAAFSKVPGAGICQIVIFCGLTEVNFGFGAYKKGGQPGDYGWKAITSTDPETKQKKLRAELANGRLAMVAIIGMFYQDGLTGSAWGDWDLYTDSPLRAFESELGVQAPVGYWDPAGYSKDGDAEAFRRRRMTEIKHGRVSMIACIGYIVPEYFKWPGLVSPSNGLAFSDVPNGLGALSKIPAGGWAQTFLFAGLIETGYFAQEDGRAPGDFANAGPLGVPNGAPSMTSAEARKTKLNAEIANGRLAMMAIIGMFFQDGLTGAAWGDWELYTASPLRAEPVAAAAAAAAAKAVAAAGATKAAGAAAASGAAAGVGVLREGMTAPGLEKSYKPFGEGPFDPSKQVGALPPLGFWDPAGLCTDEATFRKYRTAEIKHARVAMMAAIGLTAAHGSKFAWIPEGTPAGLAALEEPAAAQAFGFLFLTAGFYELKFWRESESRAPGDFGDPAGWTTTFGGVNFDDELRNRELANGRFSMFAVIGILVAEQQTGLDGVDQLSAAIARWQTMGGFENF